MPFDPNTISCWVFDLDNTLYPARSNLFDQVRERITAFVQDNQSLGRDDALALQRDLFIRHGTTLNGLMAEYQVDAHAYLDYVHDIDYTRLDPDPTLAALLERFPGRKLIYTNGSTSHAQNAMEQLGVDHHFEAIFDIVAADFRPKPDFQAFQKFLLDHAVDAKAAVFVEDMAINLKPAAALGFTTVWLRTDQDWAKTGADSAHVHHQADDLVSLLQSLSQRLTAA